MKYHTACLRKSLLMNSTHHFFHTVTAPLLFQTVPSFRRNRLCMLNGFP